MRDRRDGVEALQPGQLWYHELLDMHAFLIGFSSFNDSAAVFQFLDGTVIDTSFLQNADSTYLNLIYRPATQEIENQRPRVENACNEDNHTFFVADPPDFLNYRLQCSDCGLSAESLVTIGQENAIDRIPVRCSVCGEITDTADERVTTKGQWTCLQCTESDDTQEPHTTENKKE